MEYQDFINRDGIVSRKAPVEIRKQFFLQKSAEVHGDYYDYSLVEYTFNYEKVSIICPKHGVFLATPNNHTNGAGCPYCNTKNYSTRVIDQVSFLSRCVEVHGNRYDYSKAVYLGTDVHVTIFCKSCNTDFQQKPHYHCSGSNCPKCAGRSYRYLYVLRATDRPTIHKIGITNTPGKRISAVSRSLGMSWELLRLYDFKEGSALPTEQQLLSLLKSFRYISTALKGLDGYSELVKMNTKDLYGVLDWSAQLNTQSVRVECSG